MMELFVKPIFVFLLMTSWATADDDVFSMFDFPFQNFNEYVTKDDSKEVTNKELFNSYYNSYPYIYDEFTNPYSRSIHKSHQQLHGFQHEPNPYGLMKTQFYTPHVLREDASDEASFDNIWIKLINGHILPDITLNPSGVDFDKSLWGAKIWKLLSGSSEEAGAINSVKRKNDGVIGREDSSEEEVHGGQNGKHSNINKIGFGQDGSDDKDSDGERSNEGGEESDESYNLFSSTAKRIRTTSVSPRLSTATSSGRNTASSTDHTLERATTSPKTTAESTATRTTNVKKTTTSERATTTKSTTRSAESTTVKTLPTLTTRKPTDRSTTAVPSTTSKPSIPDICEGSDVTDKVGYKSHWSDCSKFIQCVLRPDGSTTVYIKSCGNGTLWDQRTLSCNPAHLVDCPHDLCQVTGLDRYPSSTSCRRYWVCKNGKSKSVCCPPKHSYDNIKGCVPNINCVEECNDEVIVQNVCDRRAVAYKPLVYEQFTEMQGWKMIACPTGSAYNEITCQCLSLNNEKPPEIECKPELYIPFNGDIRDESGNNNYLQVDGVTVVDSTGYFSGQSVIRVPRFSNQKFGDTVIIKLRYKEEGVKAGSNTAPQALVANGDCNLPSSLYLVTGQGGLTVGLQTTEGSKANVSIPDSQSAGWKEAVLVRDKSVLQGTLDGISYQTLFTGTIEPSKCSLQIGRGTEFAPFRGYMDDIIVYLCKPKGF